MTRRQSPLLIIILLFSFLNGINPTTANFSANVYILEAWYEDLDGDGLQDDIGVDVMINLCNNYVYTNVDLYIGIELPSGADFWFTTSFTVKKYTYCEANGAIFDLFNTARESGWYTAYGVAFAEGERYSQIDRLVFDPPGSNGGNPSGRVDFYNIN